jgi:sugar O-acyltransferase (sialic acid O-acetyltransferase NeuD family)
MSKERKLIIFGSGTLAEIAAFYFQRDSDYDVLGFTDGDEFITQSATLMNLPIQSWQHIRTQYSPADVDLFVAIGYRKTNTVRQMRYEAVKKTGYRCASYISSKAVVFTEKIGENCFILENNVLQPFVEIGNNVTMWSGNHIGHHSIIEDHVFIASHAVVSGKCTIGANSFLGVNCCLHDNIRIGEKSVIGAGAIITSSCERRSLFVPQKTEARIVDRDLL